jgi:hypothetical protein
MLTSREYWRSLAVESGPGTILLVVLTSWRTVASDLGMEAADLLSGMFDVTCGLAAETTELRARVSTTVYSAFWSGAESHTSSERAAEKLRNLLPLTLSWRNNRAEVAAKWTEVHWAANSHLGTVYDQARVQLDELLARQPAASWYPALTETWQEALGL